MKPLSRRPSFILFASSLLLGLGLPAAAASGGGPKPVALIRDGKAVCAIYAPEGVMEPDRQLSATVSDIELAAERERRTLRDSVNDLSLYLGKISGASVEIRTGNPEKSDGHFPILIGPLAQVVFGPTARKAPYKQGWRVVVSVKGVGLLGESPESASYAVYELLDRLGCRWYLPSDVGEVIPRMKTILLPVSDVSGAPATSYRQIWYADADFKRRNRLGGFNIQCGQILEDYLSHQQLTEHPDWNAMMNGQRSINGRICWGNPAVSDAVADAIIARLDQHYVPSISLSPKDGASFCDCPLCKALDAGDFDPVMDTPSITDRYVNFCNRIAVRVAKKYPDVKLGFLAYVQFTQPPVRENLRPSLVPVLAPINYCRAHSMTDTRCPSRQLSRRILEGWARASQELGYYGYMFNLAEYSAPYPMIRQMSEELPIVYANHVKYWLPEGISNQESVLPGHYLSMRMAWDPTQKPGQILGEFFAGFYGSASEPMRRYWTLFDAQWNNVDEHAGSGWGYWRRFTPEFMARARQTMNSALAACRTPMETRRVKMQDDALNQFEIFMRLRRDLNEGRLTDLGSQSDLWMTTQKILGDQYEKQYAFDKIYWTPVTAAGQWFRGFFEPAYLDGSRIARDFTVVSSPLRKWRYTVDKEKRGEATGWSAPQFDDSAWKSTDVGLETWATLGLEHYYGPVWYRSKVQVPLVPEGKKIYLWISAGDGDVELFVNGQAVPYVDEKGVSQPKFTNGYCKPLSFDITAVVKTGANNQITIVGSRVFINELGTGGLLGPAYLYTEK